MTDLPIIYYNNGNFLIFNRKHMLNLRHKRIVGKLIGCSTKNPHQVAVSGLPCLINHYYVYISMKQGLAQFKRLVTHKQVDVEQNSSEFSKKLDELEKRAREEVLARRSDELKKRNITPAKPVEFGRDRLKLTITDEPSTEFSSLETQDIYPDEILSILKIDFIKMAVFEDLYNKNYYLTTGLKFGADFLVYINDPIRYHAKNAVRCLESANDMVDMTKIDHDEVNAFNRLCNSANKVPTFATVRKDKKVDYWTLKDREYLSPDSNNIIFRLIELSQLNSKASSSRID